MTSTKEILIFHNPRCSKSRQALELIREQGIDPTVVEYLKTPPSASELRDILRLLGLAPRQLMRRKEPEYAELNLDDASLTDAQLIEAMVRYPKLIERPIVIKDGKAAIGRPPERVLDLLDPTP